jgi:hypothetical protein
MEIGKLQMMFKSYRERRTRKTAWGLVREPDAGNPHVRFDERGVETELRLSH